MSTESAKQFVKRMQEDKAFADAVEKLAGKEARTAFVKQEGFDFSKDELASIVSELNVVDVAGGKCCGAKCELDCPRDRHNDDGP